MEWFQLADEDKRAVIEEVAEETGLSSNAVEKDQWVSIALRTVFSLDVAEHLVFKGGTSLSKAWGAIERFSEDIDLVLDREYLGYGGELSKNKIKDLKKGSCRFITEDFARAFEEKLNELEVPYRQVSIEEIRSDLPDKDPVNVYLEYDSITEGDRYIPPPVRLEIGSRALLSPKEDRPISSMIDAHYSGRDFAEDPIDIPSVHPRRTFLEKAMLLHEEFQKDPEKIRYERMSRHLYDLERLMDAEPGKEALQDPGLFQKLKEHREHFTPIKGVDHKNLSPSTIDFIPPEKVEADYRSDYDTMREEMIYGEKKDYDQLIERMEELRERFRGTNEG